MVPSLLAKYFDDFYKEHVINKGGDIETTEQTKIDDFLTTNNESDKVNDNDNNIDEQPNRDENIEESSGDRCDDSNDEESFRNESRSNRLKDPSNRYPIHVYKHLC